MTDSSLTTPDPAAIEAALDRVMTSPVFAQAQRQRRLLDYIVRESLAGRGGRISQFSIGIDVFDRGADFDPTTDSAVRVEVSRLRAKLREYYELYPDEAVIFRLPKGRYVADIAPTAMGQPASIATSAASNSPLLVVLPFENLSGDVEDDYFADGISDDLITDLTKISGLKVIARPSAFKYKDGDRSPARLREELGVTHALEGSIRRAGKRVRINAQLIDCAKNEPVWAERYDREITDIFELQDDVGRRIVTALSVALTAADRFAFFDRRTENLEAYDLVLRAGRLDFSYDGIGESVDLLRRAVQLDPEYGLANARLAFNLWYAVFCGWSAATTSVEAMAAAERSVSVDPDNADVQSIYSFTHFWFGDIDIANAAGDRSISLDPANVRALERRAICLCYLARFDEADSHLQRAQALNPHEPYFHPRGLLTLMRGDLIEAVKLLEASRQRFPSFMPSRVFLTCAYWLLDDKEKAVATYRSTRDIHPSTQFDWLVQRWGSVESAQIDAYAAAFCEAQAYVDGG